MPRFVTKIIELFQTFNVRFGVMAVGPTGGGKSCCYRALQEAMTTLHEDDPEDGRFQPVRTYVFNPKCITMGELYGEFNALTQEWTDGIASSMIRAAVTLTTQNDDYQWVVFDGPVDALWIENMNTVLDDNMTLCLANGERIKLNSKMHMLFEVADLAVASPATVSRCGMVYLTPENMTWQPRVTSWMQKELYPAVDKAKPPLTQELCDYLYECFDATVDAGIKCVRSNAEMVPTVDSQLTDSLCSLFVAMLPIAKINLKEDIAKLKPMVANIFTFCYVWSIGAALDESSWTAFDDMVREQFADRIKMPASGVVYDFFIEGGTCDFKLWKEITPDFVFNAKMPFFSMLVPTVDTVR